MNWTLVGSVAMGLVFLFVFPERYTRTDIDIYVDKAETGHPETTVTARHTVYQNPWNNQETEVAAHHSPPATNRVPDHFKRTPACIFRMSSVVKCTTYNSTVQYIHSNHEMVHKVKQYIRFKSQRHTL